MPKSLTACCDAGDGSPLHQQHRRRPTAAAATPSAVAAGVAAQNNGIQIPGPALAPGVYHIKLQERPNCANSAVNGAWLGAAAALAACVGQHTPTQGAPGVHPPPPTGPAIPTTT